MPDGRERFKQNTTGCHTSALGGLFIADERRFVQEKVYEVDSPGGATFRYKGKKCLMASASIDKTRLEWP
jgi:hypothetical protein